MERGRPPRRCGMRPRLIDPTTARPATAHPTSRRTDPHRRTDLTDGTDRTDDDASPAGPRRWWWPPPWSSPTPLLAACTSAAGRQCLHPRRGLGGDGRVGDTARVQRHAGRRGDAQGRVAGPGGQPALRVRLHGGRPRAPGGDPRQRHALGDRPDHPRRGALGPCRRGTRRGGGRSRRDRQPRHRAGDQPGLEQRDPGRPGDLAGGQADSRRATSRWPWRFRSARPGRRLSWPTSAAIRSRRSTCRRLQAGAPIAVGPGPQTLAVSAGQVLVGNFSNSTVTPINASTLQPGKAVPIPLNPTAMAVAPSGATTYVCGGAGLVPVTVNALGLAVGPAIALPGAAQGIALTADGSVAWVTQQAGSVDPGDAGHRQGRQAAASGRPPLGHRHRGRLTISVTCCCRRRGRGNAAHAR